MRRWKATRTEAGAPSPVRRPTFSIGSVVVSQWDQAGEPEHGHPVRALGRHGLIIAVNGPRATVGLPATSVRLRP
jgi:hypothetical protein